ncbi:DUF1329 domain-containing protein [Seongchinamella unica]|uniref:DUF1329 domain-containing protein n=1 Tax=Seongchinamella unica TaxID=2547392 RepID=A0A4R5LT23_9GAMM|nr:DUF1329 domain-containing protein [Seongchinamella unica]TDG14051.1 DUF1329 domain-containing protein [Seongchinamella unica]
MFKKTATTLALAAAIGSSQSAMADVVDNSFYPYKDGAPSFPGLEVGMTINASNADQFKDALDPATYEQLKNGWWEMQVAETTSFDLYPAYVEATRSGMGKVSLGDELGQINGFVAGRPFPEEPSADDPRAGEKLAWNYKYGYNWGDSAAIYPFYWKYRDLESGKVERTLKYNFHFLNYKHRVQHDPVPEFADNPSDLFRAIYVQVLEPFDVKNTQLLIHRSSDDQTADNTWLYLGFQRRVRRLSSGQITDAFLGADIMIEDFEGYNGRISDMNWTYKGTKNIMLPFFNHNDLELATDLVESDGYQFVDFGGKGGCFPKITWQLRKVYVLESDPIDENHPISKRVHYVDAQTFTLPRTLIYDRKGDLWKSWLIGQAHPDHHLEKNKGTGVSIDDAFSMLDIQAGHCTTGQFKGQVDPELNQVKLFTVQNMRAKGR